MAEPSGFQSRATGQGPNGANQDDLEADLKRHAKEMERLTLARCNNRQKRAALQHSLKSKKNHLLKVVKIAEKLKKEIDDHTKDTEDCDREDEGITRALEVLEDTYSRMQEQFQEQFQEDELRKQWIDSFQSNFEEPSLIPSPRPYVAASATNTSHRSLSTPSGQRAAGNAMPPPPPPYADDDNIPQYDDDPTDLGVGDVDDDPADLGGGDDTADASGGGDCEPGGRGRVALQGDDQPDLYLNRAFPRNPSATVDDRSRRFRDDAGQDNERDDSDDIETMAASAEDVRQRRALRGLPIPLRPPRRFAQRSTGQKEPGGPSSIASVSTSEDEDSSQDPDFPPRPRQARTGPAKRKRATALGGVVPSTLLRMDVPVTRTVEFVDLHCKHESLYQFPWDGGDWYFLRCDIHKFHPAGTKPWFGMIKHAALGDHPDLKGNVSHAAILQRFGTKVSGCDEYLADQHNRRVQREQEILSRCRGAKKTTDIFDVQGFDGAINAVAGQLYIVDRQRPGQQIEKWVGLCLPIGPFREPLAIDSCIHLVFEEPWPACYDENLGLTGCRETRAAQCEASSEQWSREYDHGADRAKKREFPFLFFQDDNITIPVGGAMAAPGPGSWAWIPAAAIRPYYSGNRNEHVLGADSARAYWKLIREKRAQGSKKGNLRDTGETGDGDSNDGEGTRRAQKRRAPAGQYRQKHIPRRFPRKTTKR